MVVGENLVMLPYALNSALDPYSGIDAGATATHRPLIVGDWKQILILDRWGGIAEYIPHLFRQRATCQAVREASSTIGAPGAMWGLSMRLGNF